MVQFRVGMKFAHKAAVRTGLEVQLVERLPSEHWDSRRDPEWVVDLFRSGRKLDTKVFAESKIHGEYITEKQ